MAAPCDSVRETLAAARSGPCVVTMGTFDGVHRGHRVLVGAARRLADAQGLPLVAVTLATRPDELFRPEAALPGICSVNERVARLRDAGAHEVVVLPFDRDVAALEHGVFAELLVTDLRLRTLVVGEDFAFGRGRLGTPARLRDHGLDVVTHPLVRDADGVEKISSSTIRAALAAGRRPE